MAISELLHTKEIYKPNPYFVVDWTEDPAGLQDINAFDKLAFATDHILESHIVLPNRGWRIKNYKPEDFDNPNCQVVGLSDLKFILIGDKMYIFPAKMTHISFYSKLITTGESGDVADSGYLTLRYEMEKFADNQAGMKYADRRIIQGISGSLPTNLYHRRKYLEPKLIQYFNFNYAND